MLENDIKSGSKRDSSGSSFEDRANQKRKERVYQSAVTNQEAYSGSGNECIDRYGLRMSKKLFKSRTDKKLFGVCGGLAKYFGISSTMVRLIFVVLTLIGWGSAAILYIVLSIVLKKEPLELT